MNRGTPPSNVNPGPYREVRGEPLVFPNTTLDSSSQSTQTDHTSKSENQPLNQAASCKCYEAIDSFLEQTLAAEILLDRQLRRPGFLFRPHSGMKCLLVCQPTDFFHVSVLNPPQPSETSNCRRSHSRSSSDRARKLGGSQVATFK